MKKLIYLLCAGVIIAGCNKTEGGEMHDPEVKIPIKLSTSVSKVSGDLFENGDNVGLYVVNCSNDASDNWISGNLSNNGNHVNNGKFTYNGSWTPDQEYYWKDGVTKADFYVYYPYTASISNVNALTIQTAADQSSKDAFESCEILWGKSEKMTPTENKVSVLTSHRMGQLIIYVKPGKGFTEETLKESLKSIEINNIKTTAILNISNGELSASGDAADIKPYYDGSCYKAMIVPQVIDNKTLVTLVVDELERSLTQTIEFTSNSRKTCTLTVNKISEGINVEIGGWEDDGNDYGGTLN